MIKKTAKKSTKKVQRAVDFQDVLAEHLKDHGNAVVYLNAALEESLKGDEESQKLFLKALRNVAEAQGSISALAKRAQVRRESLYRMLSDNGNPALSSLVALLHAMGFQLNIR